MAIPGLSGPGSGFAIGYGAQIVGQGASAYFGLQDGRYVSPEQQMEAVNDTAYSTMGLIAGTVIGAAVAGPEGAIAGQFIGQAGGGVLSSYLNAGEERAQSTRETAEALGTELGAATSQIREFAKTLSEAGAPIKELQTAFSTMGSLAPGLNGTTSISGAADLANALGERFNPALAGTAGFLAANPVLAPLLPQFNEVGGKLSPDVLGNLAIVAAYGGNFAASEQALTLEEGAANSSARAKDIQTVQDYRKGDPGQEGWDIVWDVFKTITTHSPRTEENSTYTAAAEAAKRLSVPDPAVEAERQQFAQARDAAFNLYTAAQGDQSFGSSSVTSVSAQLSLADMRGATDAEMSKLGTSLTASIETANPSWSALSTSLSKSEDSITKLLADHPEFTDKQRDEYRTLEHQLAALRNQADTMPLQNKLADAQAQRSILERSIGTNEADFAGWQTSNTLAGATPTQMAGGFDNEAQYYEDLANTSQWLRPAERARFRQHAQQIRFQSGTNGEDSFLQDISVLGTERNALGEAVNEEKRVGPYAGIACAENRLAENELQQVQRDHERIGQGVPWQEQQRLTREIDTLTGMAAQTTYAAGINQYEGERSDLNYGISDPGLSRRLRLLGNSGMTSDDLDTVRSEYTLDQGEIVRNTDPKRRAMLEDRLQGDEAMLADREETARRFRPSARQSSYMVEAETQYELARLAPWEGGPESNPWQRGMVLENALKGQIAARENNRSRLIGQGQWNDIDQLNFAQDNKGDLLREGQLEHQQVYGMLEALPEAVIGSPGGGIGAAVINPAAVSAYFNPSPLTGGFGNTPGTPAQMANPPGSLAGFQQTAMGGGDLHTTNNLLRELIQAITSGRGINAGGVPHNDASGAISMFLGKSFDPVNRR